MLAFLERFAQEMQHQYPLTFLLATHLAYLQAFLVLLGTFATLLQWCRRFVHQGLFAQKTQLILLYVLGVIIARLKLVFPSCVLRAYIALQCLVSPLVAPMARIVTYLGCLKPNNALPADFVREIATILWFYHVPSGTFVLPLVLKRLPLALEATFALVTQSHHRLVGPDTFVPQAPLTSSFAQ
jgi:hypothetical protein